MLIGLSTHAPAEIDAVDPALVDYIGVGPVHETPTKAGRPAVGLELVRYAAANARVPFFAIGGLNAGNIGEVTEAGATRVVVLRAIADAADPEAAARELRTKLGGSPDERPAARRPSRCRATRQAAPPERSPSRGAARDEAARAALRAACARRAAAARCSSRSRSAGCWRWRCWPAR